MKTSYSLFADNVNLFLRYADTIMSDPKMYLAQVSTKKNTRFNNIIPTLGTFIEFWRACKEKGVETHGYPIYHMIGSVLYGGSCTAMTPDGEKVSAELRISYADLLKLFNEIHERYAAQKAECEPYSLTEVIERLNKLKVMEIISPLPKKSYHRWNNFDGEINEVNLNSLYRELGLPEDSRLNQGHEISKLHFSLFVVSESPETGVLLRLRLAKFDFSLAESVDVVFVDTDEDLLQTFMKALGLEFVLDPTPADSVALARKLCELDNEFKTIFDNYFVFDEIAKDRHDLLLQLRHTKNKLHGAYNDIADRNEIIADLQTKLAETKRIVQRILINQHIAECKQLIKQAAEIDHNEKEALARYQACESLLTDQGIPANKIKRSVAEAKNRYDGARFKASAFHDKEIRRIFGDDYFYIDYDYLKALVSDINEKNDRIIRALEWEKLFQ